MIKITDTYVFVTMLREALDINYNVTADMLGDLDPHNKDDLIGIEDYCEQLVRTTKYIKLLDAWLAPSIDQWSLTLKEHDYLRYIVTQYHNLRDEDVQVEKVFTDNDLPTYNSERN